MPEVGEIMGALRQAAEGLRKAQSAAAQLDASAQQVQSRAGGTGFHRVAELVGQVRQRVNRIRQAQAALVATVTPISDTVRRVTDSTNPAEVVAALSPAAQQISTASTRTSAILGEIDRLKTDIEAATKGGQPGPLIAMANSIKHAIAHAAAASTPRSGARTRRSARRGSWEPCPQAMAAAQEQHRHLRTRRREIRAPTSSGSAPAARAPGTGS